jgi:hypothetical protein
MVVKNMTDTTITTDTTTLQETAETQAIPPQVTWDDVRKMRNDMLHHAEQLYKFDFPEELLKQFQDYKQALRDLPETYKDLKDLHLIEWPQEPSTHQDLQLSRLG